LPWEEMAALTQRKARHLILFGEAAVLIEQAMQIASRVERACEIHQAGTRKVRWSWRPKLARPGDVVLLSAGRHEF